MFLGLAQREGKGGDFISTLLFFLTPAFTAHSSWGQPMCSGDEGWGYPASPADPMDTAQLIVMAEGGPSPSCCSCWATGLSLGDAQDLPSSPQTQSSS